MENEKVANLKSKFKGLTVKGKIIAIVCFIIALILFFFVCAILVGQMMKAFVIDKTISSLKLGLTKGMLATLCVYCVLILLGLFSFLSTNMRNTVEYTENGIRYGKDKVGGTARWMSENEVEKNFYVGDIKSSTSTIYGKMDKNSNKRIATYKRPDGPEGNRNTLVVASMGSGKTYTYVINELIQTILRGDSFVCTDPKGELFTTLAQWCKEKGVDVHLLNLDPKHVKSSEFWNCLQETIDPDTERLDPSRLNDFVNIYMQNSGEGKEDFWYNSALNLVKAVIGYISYNHEMDIINGYAELYEAITESSTDNPFTEKIKNSMVSFKEIRLTIESEALKRGYSVDEIEKIFNKIEKIKPKYKYNIGEVVDALLDFETIEPSLQDIPDWHPAAFSYKMYKTNDTETVRKSALQGAQLRFSLFSDPNIKDVLSYDGINITDINMKQSAYFVIISDKVDTLKPIQSLFFSFFFKDILDNFDAQKQKAEQLGNSNPCLGVTAMLEEFFSIGVISGSPRAFGKIMATCRSRKLYVSIIIQYISQLEELYGPFIKDAIQGGCATLYYLGGNDLPTMKFISDFAGQTTVITESHQEGSSILSKTGTNVNVSAKSRPLFTEEDARLLRQRVLVIKQGCQPVKFYPFGWDDHWVCYKGKDVHPKGYIHMKPNVITNSNGKKQTLWEVAPDSYTSFDGYIIPIDQRVKHINDLKLEHPDIATEINNDIRNLSKVEMNNTVDSDAADNENNEETEVINMPEEVGTITKNEATVTSNVATSTDNKDSNVPDNEGNSETEVLWLDQLSAGDKFTKADLNKVGELPDDEPEETEANDVEADYKASGVSESNDIIPDDEDINMDDLINDSLENELGDDAPDKSNEAQETSQKEDIPPTQQQLDMDFDDDLPEKKPSTRVGKLRRTKGKK